MGAIKGTAHVAKTNIQKIKMQAKRENYLQKINELLAGYQNRYESIFSQLDKEAIDRAGRKKT